MNTYQNIFKRYLNDLAKRKPSPGGGSVICLMFCQGAGLIEKAFNYSCVLNVASSSQGRKNKKIKKNIDLIYGLRKKIYPFIDRDGKIFERVIANKGKRRDFYVKQSQSLMSGLASACLAVLSLAQNTESDIKNNMLSDFYIGKECVSVALAGAVKNLKANKELFGAPCSSIGRWEKQVEKWQYSIHKK